MISVRQDDGGTTTHAYAPEQAANEKSNCATIHSHCRPGLSALVRIHSTSRGVSPGPARESANFRCGC